MSKNPLRRLESHVFLTHLDESFLFHFQQPFLDLLSISIGIIGCVSQGARPVPRCPFDCLLEVLRDIGWCPHPRAISILRCVQRRRRSGGWRGSGRLVRPGRGRIGRRPSSNETRPQHSHYEYDKSPDNSNDCGQESVAENWRAPGIVVERKLHGLSRLLVFEDGSIGQGRTGLQQLDLQKKRVAMCHRKE